MEGYIVTVTEAAKIVTFISLPLLKQKKCKDCRSEGEERAEGEIEGRY